MLQQGLKHRALGISGISPSPRLTAPSNQQHPKPLEPLNTSFAESQREKAFPIVLFLGVRSQF